METVETVSNLAVRTSNQQPFDKRLIAHIVSLVEQGVPRKVLVEQYGMASCTLCAWLKNYGASSVRKDFSVAHKRSVVRAVAAGMSIKQAAVAYQVTSPGLIKKWIKAFKEENVEISVSKPTDMAKKKTDQSESAAIKALKKELEFANMKIKALDTMIDIAEEQLKVDIRKKSGAKQSEE
ncbi:helix-turn-helix domain-containing protein [Pedobacter sp. SAFR-022]|uniref:helix-turn-helix domain-containing protein n=1 Tax=Pedobacter sp. SAFR-022 TaxID=3436861 RepID=UPI003F7CEBA5